MSAERLLALVDATDCLKTWAGGSAGFFLASESHGIESLGSKSLFVGQVKNAPTFDALEEFDLVNQGGPVAISQFDKAFGSQAEQLRKLKQGEGSLLDAGRGGGSKLVVKGLAKTGKWFLIIE